MSAGKNLEKKYGVSSSLVFECYGVLSEGQIDDKFLLFKRLRGLKKLSDFIRYRKRRINLRKLLKLNLPTDLLLKIWESIINSEESNDSFDFFIHHFTNLLDKSRKIEILKNLIHNDLLFEHAHNCLTRLEYETSGRIIHNMEIHFNRMRGSSKSSFDENLRNFEKEESRPLTQVLFQLALNFSRKWDYNFLYGEPEILINREDPDKLPLHEILFFSELHNLDHEYILRDPFFFEDDDN